MDSLQFEKKTFLQLIKEKEISIPIIQRDYAQGRPNKADLREKFLTELLAAFKSPLVLDFVYGSTKNNILYPLDGQQRLTTLFLLHWYIALKEDKFDEFRDYVSKKSDDDKKEIVDVRFRYETRTTAREFCFELIKNDLKYDKDFVFSEIIRNQPWYISFWDNDATISSMLVMIDDIHRKFKETENLWPRLIDFQNPPISFMYIELENFGLTDDLYIKMNARGKQLTTFENFKALFEKEIDKNGYESKYNDIEQIEQKFSYKIDMDWLDLFWSIGKPTKTSPKPTVDENMLNFTAGIAMYLYAEKFNEKDETKSLFIKDRIKSLGEDARSLKIEDYPTIDSYQQLYDSFELYSKKSAAGEDTIYPLTKIKPTISLYGITKSNNLFQDFIASQTDNKITYKERVLFYAQTLYLSASEGFNQITFDDWMRVIRNIVQNSTIDSAETFCAAVKLVKELSSGALEIYTYIKNNNTVSGHAKEQVYNEKLKANAIFKDDKNKVLIQRMEDLTLFKGNLKFAFLCIDYNKITDDFNYELLEKVENVVKQYLNKKDISNDFRRALFTIGNHDFYTYWNSYLYVIGAPKYRLILNLDDLRDNYLQTKNNMFNQYLKELVLKLIEKSLSQIIEEYLKTDEYKNLQEWLKKIISEPKLLDFCTEHYIATDSNDCWLIPNTRVKNDENGRKKLIQI